MSITETFFAKRKRKASSTKDTVELLTNIEELNEQGEPLTVSVTGLSGLLGDDNDSIHYAFEGQPAWSGELTPESQQKVIKLVHNVLGDTYPDDIDQIVDVLVDGLETKLKAFYDRNKGNFENAGIELLATAEITTSVTIVGR
jgi:hypothetical protein